MNGLHLLTDHLKRTLRATSGFRVAGADWIAPWAAYAVSPALARLLPDRTIEFEGFSTRLGRGDLYTFANLFEDYPFTELGAALGQVDKVVDAGANVGAFSWLALETARQLGRRIAVVAVEPAPENVAHLASQPYASELTVKHGAVGPEAAKGRLCAGQNSVTHTVTLDEGDGDSESIEVFTLAELCDVPVLLKMDVEGAEFAILKRGLPETVRYLFLEWHPGPESDRPEDPRGLVPGGEWQLLSLDLYGASMWFWRKR